MSIPVKEARERMPTVPLLPGCYIFRDGKGGVLYVGKAKLLRNRVRSYFGRQDRMPWKTRSMVEKAVTVEYIITDTEIEALVLESNLIKHHRPRYNVVLRDDKSFLYLKVTLNEVYPRVMTTRRILDDGAQYYGPYTSAYSLRDTMNLLNRMFPYRSCALNMEKEYDRPCLDFHIKRCAGPCIRAVSQEEYAGIIQQVMRFLEGRPGDVIQNIRVKMREASDALEFERAAVMRDRIRAVERVLERQKITNIRQGDIDVIGFAREEDEACVQVFSIRGGHLLGRENFILEHAADEEDRDVIRDFLQQFYGRSMQIPQAIFLPVGIRGAELLRMWLRERRGGSVTLSVPKIGEKRRLVELAGNNARQGLQDHRLRHLDSQQRAQVALTELADVLDLDSAPVRIECYDISNIQGAYTVGAMAVFVSGLPSTGDYRRFRIKSVDGPNDFASLQEMLTRRLKRLSEQRAETETGEHKDSDGRVDSDALDSWGVKPDLLVIDGGKGQLNAVLEVLANLALHDIPILGLAKQREEIFLPGESNPITLAERSEARKLLQRVRDEAHRFAITYHRTIRSKHSFGSLLDKIPGIGTKRKVALLQHFGSVDAIREAPVEALASAPKMNRSVAQKIKEHL